MRQPHLTWLPRAPAPCSALAGLGVLSVCGVLGGCGGTTADVATLVLDDADVSVDTLCPSACAGDTPLLTVSIPEDITIGSSASLELVQYRVDYALPSLSGAGEVPFFAAELGALAVAFAGSTAFALDPAGDQQRDWVYAQVGGEGVEGVATVTIAAYDEQDALVNLSLDFDITFADLETAAASADKDGQ